MKINNIIKAINPLANKETGDWKADTLLYFVNSSKAMIFLNLLAVSTKKTYPELAASLPFQAILILSMAITLIVNLNLVKSGILQNKKLTEDLNNTKDSDANSRDIIQGDRIYVTSVIILCVLGPIVVMALMISFLSVSGAR